MTSNFLLLIQAPQIANAFLIVCRFLHVSEVKCECKPGYIGDGFSCTGNLLQVLASTATFSNFLTVSPMNDKNGENISLQCNFFSRFPFCSKS